MKSNKTVVILDHPNYDLSNANRRFVEEMRKYPDDILIHNLQSCYPTGQIDAIKEHCLIDNNGSLVFEFPLYWVRITFSSKLRWCSQELLRAKRLKSRRMSCGWCFR